MDDGRKVTVIGAGIVGVCTALHLLREGFDVTLVDRHGPGEGASSGNSGNLALASCPPQAMPGVIKKVPRMLFDRRSPLKLRWSHAARALPWFARFVAAARPGNVEAIARARHSLIERLHEGLDPLVEEAGAEHLIDYSGLLLTVESQQALKAARYGLDLRRRNGVVMDLLDGDQARQIEPSLSQNVVRAAHVHRLAHVLDPLRLVQALASHFEERGGQILRQEVRDLEIGPAGPRAIRTNDAPIAVSKVVVAAGVWSRRLAARLGSNIPLEAERGYHTMFNGTDLRMRVPVMSLDRYVTVTPMNDGIRAGGIAEFAGIDAAPNMENARLVRYHAQQLLPKLKSPRITEWMGHRPSHPDSKPVIGRSPRFPNVFFAFGHDHIGLSLGGITGKLVAELVAGRPPSVDLEPFRADRF